jgi:phosphonate transport system permease protein
MASPVEVSMRQEPQFQEWKRGGVGQRAKQAAMGVLLLALTALAAWRCNVNSRSLFKGFDKLIPLMGFFFPPDWAGLVGMLQPLAVTVVLALTATILAMCFSLPCALAASSNFAPAPLRLAMRAFIALERGLPEIVQLLLLIAIFGLGVVPGLIALSVSSIGMLAKLLADGIEEIEPHMLEAVAGTGATRSQVVRYSVIPQILPALLANGLFQFEFNMRTSIILGAIGAGGIGYVMRTSMMAMDFHTACMATLLTLALVFATERISDFFRVRILSGGMLR